MKRLLSFTLSLLLFTGSLLPNSDLCELVKVPSLVHHYFEHLGKSNNQLSFADFLTMHYAEAREDNTQDDHKNLPFFDHCPVVPVFTIAETANACFEVPSCEMALSEYSVPHYTFRHSISIFQPPRTQV